MGKFKAYLMAKSLTQIEGIDHEKTFSPVVRFASVCLPLALVAHLDLFQMSINTTFHNCNIEEEIYIDHPISFVSKGQEDKMCLLKRSIYGLKQFSKSCYFRSHKAITSFGLFMVYEAHYVYVKRTTRGIMFLTLYVDNILLARNNWEIIKATK